MENFQWGGERFSVLSYPPRGVDFSYIDWVVVPALTTQFLSSIFGVLFTYNLGLWFALTLSGYATYRLALAFDASVEGAFLAGAAFSLCPALMGQIVLGHFYYVLGAGLISPFLLFLVRCVRAEEPAPWAVGALLTWALLLRTCHYYALFLIPLCLVLVSWDIWVSRKAKLKNALALLLGGVTISSAVIFGVLSTTTDASFSLNRINVEFYDADLLGWLTPSPYHPLWGEFFARSGDRIVYSGFALLFVGFVGLRKISLIFPVLWLFSNVMALGPVLYAGGERIGEFPWAKLFEIPGYEGIQVWARAGLLSHLFLCLWVAQLIDTKRKVQIIGLILTLEFMVFPLPIFDGRPAELLTELKQSPPGAVLYLPYEATNTEPLYYQMQHDHAMLRSALLRPTEQFLQFYNQLSWVKSMTTKDGYNNPPEADPHVLQTLTGLGFICLDKSRLTEEQSKGWQACLRQNFSITNELENEKFLVLSLEAPPSKPLTTELSFESSDDGVCFWNLHKTRDNEGSNTKEIGGAEASIWLPAGVKVDHTLTIVSRSDKSIGSLLQWNGELAGSVVGGNRWITTTIRIPASKVQVGANRLDFVLSPGQDSGVFLNTLRFAPDY